MDHITKLLHKVPLKHRIQVLETIDCLHNPPCRQTLRVEKLAGSELLKVRSGKYRVSFIITHTNQVAVKFIRLRNEKTYRDM